MFQSIKTFSERLPAALSQRAHRWRVNAGIWRLTRAVTRLVQAQTGDKAGASRLLRRSAPRNDAPAIVSAAKQSSAAQQSQATGYQLPATASPVILFNASTRLTGVSQNAAFSLLTALGLELVGVPVVHFACHAGMSQCVLGAQRGLNLHGDPSVNPPCRACIAQSHWLLASAPTVPFTYQEDPTLAARLETCSLAEMKNLEYPLQTGERGRVTDPPLHLPLGALALPAVRWVLRRHHIEADPAAPALYRRFILSAYQIAREFDALLARLQPQAVVVFNGMSYPEATARWLARQRGIRVISHEVGLMPYTAFFTTGDATAYPLDIPADFELTPEQDARLDAYLAQRSRGQFSMAGVRFWSDMQELGPDFNRRAADFKQVIPIFTNVIFDTSQPHSNVVFEQMFAWLDQLWLAAQKHPETLFVLRAHPDEARLGKHSRESVAEWYAAKTETLPNWIFIPAEQTLSSYELIRRAKFVLIYNSTIGLEAAIMGAPVLCAGRSRFTRLPTVFFPRTQAEYLSQLETFLKAEQVEAPPEFRRNARRFLYYQLYRSGLPFGEYIQDDGLWPGFVRLRDFPAERLRPENSPAMKVLLAGILHDQPFILPEDI